MNSDGTFNVAEYEAYSPSFLPATFAFVYGISFAALTAVPVHIYLWHGKEIKDAFAGRTKLDIHARLMRLYKQTPWYWYGAITVVVLVASMLMVHFYHTSLPVWAILLATIIPAIYIIPCGIIQGITNVNANQLNVLSEFIAGYMFKGRPLASKSFIFHHINNRLRISRYDLQNHVHRCRRSRTIFRTRHETWPLPESSTSNTFLRPRQCNCK